MEAESKTALMRLRSAFACAVLALVFAVFGTLIMGCGQAIPFTAESRLGPATIDGTGETRTDGGNLGTIYPVTTIITGGQNGAYGITGWNFDGASGGVNSANDFPFPGQPIAIGNTTTDRQTPFEFNFTYPPNNYQLGEAHLVIETQRDTSDTEGIFVDGVFTGRPPSVNGASTQVTDPFYILGLAAADPTKNTYYIDWSLAHYKQLTRNTFDLNLDDLLEKSAKTPVDVLSDGYLPVVTGDDSPVFDSSSVPAGQAPLLVLKGYTISKTPLTCSPSSVFTFRNVFLYNDGNSIGTAAFLGNPVPPYTSWAGGPLANQSVELYYDAQLPRVDTANITLATGTITMSMKRSATGYAAMVVSGVGVDEAGFDRTQGSAEVESWADAATQTRFATFLAGLPADGASHAVTLDLRTILTESVLLGLLAQGKLNVAFAGSLIAVQGAESTANRVLSHPVAGPELNLTGSYFTSVCQVPDDPTSPLQDGAPAPSGLGDHDSPIVSSIQATEITSSTAVIQWLSDEGSSSQVAYGVGDPTALTTNDATMTTFHRVTLTGLQPYKYYYYQVRSADSNGNLTVSGAKLFRTLR